MSEPFAYPSAPLSRRHSPRGYTDYHSYRPWLRDEFCFRCAYCLLREQWGQVRGGHSIDHFEAVAQNPDRVNDYDNLLYACATCNLAKAARNVPDPTAVLLSPNVWVSPEGAMHATNPEAAKLIDLLGLDRPKAREYRALWTGIIKLAAAHDPALHQRLMGFPDDLPDLARLRPPGGNARLKGLEQCFFAQKQCGTLASIY